MASPKPQVSCSEESSVVQVLDSNEPLVASSSLGPPCSSAMPSVEASVVQVWDFVEPLVASSSAGPPFGQVLDSSDPLGPMIVPSEPVTSSSPVTVPSAVWILPPASPTSSESSVSDAEPRASGSSGRRVHYYSAEIRSHWNMYKVITRLNTPAQCIAFAEEHRLLPTEKMCTYHRRPMRLSSTSKTGQLGIFRCRKSNCRSRAVSRATGTWFENARLSIELQFLLMYMFSQKYSYRQVKLETAREDRGTVLSTRTIADWFSHCRETVVIYELEHQEVNGKIGGPGKIVQIEKSKFIKSKYNGGRHIEGHWVLGMIENGKYDLRLEVCPDNDRSAEMFVPLIQKHVEVGTEIHTDVWTGYDCLPQYGYIHKKVNQSNPTNEYVASEGTHTQRIVDLWRRKIRRVHKDFFAEFIKAVQYVYKID